MPDIRQSGAGGWEWAVAARALPGEDEPGDLAVITPVGQRTLVAVADGLGHGQEAVAAARVAVETIQAHACDDLPELFRRCDLALRRTRGAVLSLALVADDGALTWTGVGNVEAVVVRASAAGPSEAEHALLLAGVVGMRVPEVRPARTALAPGDRLILATDGIDRSFADGLPAGPPQRIADDILERHASDRDDALVLVGQFGRARP